MSNQHARCDGLKQVVEVAVSAAGFVANLEAIRQPFVDPHHLVDRFHLRAVHDLASADEHADRDTFAVNVESDVKPRRLPGVRVTKPETLRPA